MGVSLKKEYFGMNWMKRSQEKEVEGQGCGLAA